MKKFLKLFLAAVILVFVVINTMKILNPGVKTQMVEHGEMEKSYTFDAIVMRDETLVKSDRKGVLESMVGEKEMVRKGKLVASIYEDEVHEEAKKKLVNINERINEIQNAVATSGKIYADDFRIEAGIDAKISEMMAAYENHDVLKLLSIKNDLGLLNDKKNAVSNDSGYSEKILASLKLEKEKYEKELSSEKQDIYSPVSGIFSTKTDGYENIINLELADKMTPNDYETLKETKVSQKNSNVVCKIVDSFEWSVAVMVTENELSNLKIGDSVMLRTQDSNKEAIAKVTYISSPDNGKYVLIATSDVSCDWSITERFTKIDFVKKKYSGLRVPSEAIRVKNNTTGVYTVVDGIIKFKPVNIYYKDDKYAIVEENNASTGGLLLYDEVIVSSGEYEVGKRLKR